MHLRGYQLGEEVSLPVLCTDADGRPVDPDACPRVAVFAAAGHAVADFALPIADAQATTGLFQGRLYLGEDFAEGQYHALFRWEAGAHHGGELRSFRVQPGGSATGQVVALHSYERPHAGFLVQQRSSGRLYKGKNPRL